MDEMRIRGTWTPVIAIAVALDLVACVPQPTNRPTPVGGLATPTPIPTPAGPTPTPSFVRPTPTPQPTFMVYKVVSGDTLGSIAKRFGTSGRSIAYWNRATYPSLDPDSSGYKPDYIALGWLLNIIPNKEVDPENLPSPSAAQPPASGIVSP